jgi:putative hydrolase of the HAD superfamily
MTVKPDLILDIAGVLATNFSPYFWQELSEKSDIEYERLIGFKREIREELWSGKISEEEFWRRLCSEFPSINEEDARLLLRSQINPLSALKELPKWSQFANIHLLSNHRAEWIAHIIRPIQKYLKSATISNEVHACKPSPEIYSVVRTHLSGEGSVLFVDDQEKNFKEARALGWTTLFADEQGDWMSRVEPLLTEQGI